MELSSGSSHNWGHVTGLMPGVKVGGRRAALQRGSVPCSERASWHQQGSGKVACKQEPANTHCRGRVLCGPTGSRCANRQLKRTSRGARFVERSTEGRTRQKDASWLISNYCTTSFRRHCHRNTHNSTHV